MRVCDKCGVAQLNKETGETTDIVRVDFSYGEGADDLLPDSYSDLCRPCIDEVGKLFQKWLGIHDPS